MLSNTYGEVFEDADLEALLNTTTSKRLKNLSDVEWRLFSCEQCLGYLISYLEYRFVQQENSCILNSLPVQLLAFGTKKSLGVRSVE